MTIWSIDQSMDRNRLTWGSHIDLNNALMDTFDVKGVVELGVGLYSTPIFRRCPRTLSIECDLGWYNKIVKDLSSTDNHKIIYHDIGGLPIQTKRWDVPKERREKNTQLYRDLDVTDYNFLFVDNHASLRRDALDILHHKFDIIVYHDCQNTNRLRPGHINHSYEKDPDVGDFVPHEDYIMIHDQTFTQWTGLLLHKSLMPQFDELRENFVKRVAQLDERLTPRLVVYL